MAVLALVFDFRPGDEIIISPLTDYGTVYGILTVNCIPVFPDIEPGTVNFNAETIEVCISDRTKGILAVHKCGLPNDMDPINELAAKHDIIVYEDCCQAAFSEYKGRVVGTLSTASAFSLDSEKTFSSDKGGCIATTTTSWSRNCDSTDQVADPRMYHILAARIPTSVTPTT